MLPASVSFPLCVLRIVLSWPGILAKVWNGGLFKIGHHASRSITMGLGRHAVALELPDARTVMANPRKATFREDSSRLGIFLASRRTQA